MGVWDGVWDGGRERGLGIGAVGDGVGGGGRGGRRGTGRGRGREEIRFIFILSRSGRPNYSFRRSSGAGHSTFRPRLATCLCSCGYIPDNYQGGGRVAREGVARTTEGGNGEKQSERASGVARRDHCVVRANR